MNRYLLLLCGLLCSATVYSQALNTLDTIAFDENSIAQRPMVINRIPLLATEARIEGGISVNGIDFKSDYYLNQGIDNVLLYVFEPADTITITFRIIPEKKHVGREADILTIIGYVTLDTLLMANATGTLSFREDISFFLLDQHNNISLLPKHWTSRDFAPFKRIKLKSTQEFNLYQGKLAAGGLALFIGYQLRDSNIIILNRDIIMSLILPEFIPPPEYFLSKEK